MDFGLEARVLDPVGPEVLVVAAEHAAAQGEDGVGTVHGPVHARALEASDHGAAAGLDDSGAHAQALCAELGIAHAAAVLVYAIGVLGGFLAAVGASPQGGEQAVDVALLEVAAAGVRPQFLMRLLAAEYAADSMRQELTPPQDPDRARASGCSMWRVGISATSQADNARGSHGRGGLASTVRDSAVSPGHPARTCLSSVSSPTAAGAVRSHSHGSRPRSIALP